MANNGKLTPKMKAFIRALLTERTVRGAAGAAGIGERTAYRWSKDPDIITALKAAELEALGGVVRRLVGLGDRATQTLADAMDSEETRENTKVRAADIILGRLLQLRELVDLEERISILEGVGNE